MKPKIDIENLLSDLDRLKKIITRYDDPVMIPDIERDILLAAIRDLYEQILSIPAGSQVLKEPEETVTAEKVPSEKIKQTEERIEFVDEKPSGELIHEVPQRHEADKPQESDEIQTKKADEKQKEKIKILAEKFQSERQYIYDSLTEKTTKQNISAKLQSKPISDIAASIGVNDKFTLIRDLFNGDTESYRKTINVLNNSSDFNEAYNYISTHFNWDMEDRSVQFILDLVRRKFIVDKNE